MKQYEEYEEVCPHCDSVNTFSVTEGQYIVICPECGEEMMLCSKCYVETVGYPSLQCNWRKAIFGGTEYGICRRGIAKDRKGTSEIID